MRQRHADRGHGEPHDNREPYRELFPARGTCRHRCARGGGTRLRLGRVAGARTDYTITPGSDFTDTWNGRTIDKVTTVDAKDQHVYDLQVSYNVPLSDRRFRWSVQLNVNNLLDQRELIVNNVHPRTLAPITYRYQDPRQFILTNTVSF